MIMKFSPRNRTGNSWPNRVLPAAITMVRDVAKMVLQEAARSRTNNINDFCGGWRGGNPRITPSRVPVLLFVVPGLFRERSSAC